MKEFIASSGPAIVVAMDDHAYAAITLNDNVLLVKLCAPNSPPSGNNTQGENPNAHTVQAVAATFSQENKQLLCAISRYDKYLSVYSLSLADSLESQTQIEPTVVHKTNKRCCALTFSHIPLKEDGNKSMDIIIAADLAGDATAFPVIAGETSEVQSCDRKVQRLLLGHTASMLTAVKVIDDKIFTADRDEKVRVSSFPRTSNVLGFLLGNAAYITDIDVKKDKYCVTTGGDCSIRLWDYNACVELACIYSEEGTTEDSSSDDQDTEGGKSTKDDQSAHIPVRVTANKDGDTIAVIYNRKDVVDLFSVVIGGGSNMIQKAQSLDCKNPLAICFINNDLLVLGKEPVYMTRFVKISDGDYAPATECCKISSALQKIGHDCGIIMPQSILETDDTGKIKLMKNIKEEGEGYVEHKPWLNGDRIQNKKDKERRRKKRRLEEELAAGTTIEEKS